MSNIPAQLIYGSVRQEILDQKRCQFQMFTTAVTVNAAVLAYAAEASSVGPFVYVAPVVMNVFALAMILDKALSIQRMVGYLQKMEKFGGESGWMWEYHLGKFRKVQLGDLGKPDSHRQHKYVRNVTLMLLLLSAFSIVLYRWGPEMAALRASSTWPAVAESYGAIFATLVATFGAMLVLAGRRWHQLIWGDYSSDSVRKRWEKVGLPKEKSSSAPSASGS